MKTVKDVGRQFTGEETIFAHPASDKRFVSRAYKDYSSIVKRQMTQ